MQVDGVFVVYPTYFLGSAKQKSLRQCNSFSSIVSTTVDIGIEFVTRTIEEQEVQHMRSIPSRV